MGDSPRDAERRCGRPRLEETGSRGRDAPTRDQKKRVSVGSGGRGRQDAHPRQRAGDSAVSRLLAAAAAAARGSHVPVGSLAPEAKGFPLARAGLNGEAPLPVNVGERPVSNPAQLTLPSTREANVQSPGSALNRALKLTAPLSPIFTVILFSSFLY